MMLLVLAFIYVVAFRCPAGFIMNALVSKCPHLRCPSAPGGCQVNVIKDQHDCPVTCDYTCGAPWCRLRPCNRICNHGYTEDAMGCNTCQCHSHCSDTWCQLDCPNGYQRDSNNCQTCTCQPQTQTQTHWCNSWATCQFGFCPDSCKCQPDCFDGYPLPDNPVILAL